MKPLNAPLTYDVSTLTDEVKAIYIRPGGVVLVNGRRGHFYAGVKRMEWSEYLDYRVVIPQSGGPIPLTEIIKIFYGGKNNGEKRKRKKRGGDRTGRQKNLFR